MRWAAGAGPLGFNADRPGITSAARWVMAPVAGDAPALAGDAPALAGDAPALAGDAPAPTGEATNVARPASADADRQATERRINLDPFSELHVVDT
jgi:hypothetical protein